MEKSVYWYWDDLLFQDQIKQINLICEKHYDPFHEDMAAENVVKTADVKIIKWKFLKPIMHNVLDTWIEKNKFTFGFDLFQISDVDLWNINTYDSKNNGEYDFHYDNSDNNISDVKLTGIVNISDEPYEGGDLIFSFPNEFTVPEIKNPGSSVLLRHGTLHKVSPVTKGIRKTLSYWLSGPRFI